MALNRRQQAAYKHTCKILSVTRTNNATTGEPGAETYALNASEVPYLRQPTPNVDDAGEGGRVKRMTVLTTDVAHFESSVTLHDGWIVKDVSLLPDGSHGPNYGECSRILGAPRQIPDAGRRKANKQSVMLMTMEHPTAEVLAL